MSPGYRDEPICYHPVHVPPSNRRLLPSENINENRSGEPRQPGRPNPRADQQTSNGGGGNYSRKRM